MENLAQLFQQSALKFGEKSAFRYKDIQKRPTFLSYKELYESGLSLAEALIEFGLEAKENVAIFSDNRAEWMITDCAIILSAAVSVPRGSDITDSEITYIINHSQSKIIFVENNRVLEKVIKQKKNIDHEITLILMQSDPERKEALDMYELLSKGRKLREQGSRNVEERVLSLKSDDLFTIIYTSGTTGQPKGVQLTHSNMIFQVRSVSPILEITEKDRAISILPIWHIFERFLEYCFLHVGGTTYYSNVQDLKQNLTDFKPTFFGAAPRVWEMICNGILARMTDPDRTSRLGRILFKLAYTYSEKKNEAKAFFLGNELDLKGRSSFATFLKGLRMAFEYLFFGPFTLSAISFLCAALIPFGYAAEEIKILLYTIGVIGLLFNSFMLDQLVLSKIRKDIVGGFLKTSVSGGGALPNRVDRTLNHLGIRLLEGYGMTETSPVISIRRTDKFVIGSVGHILPKTRLQIRTEKNEVLSEIDENGKFTKGKPGQKGVVFASGPHIMKGYYKNPDITADALNAGWMNTGDIGIVSYNRTLTLAGRAKETIVLRGGENVEPVPIEAKLQVSKYISQCMVIGQDQKNLGAIIVPDFESLIGWAKENYIPVDSIQELLQRRQVIDLYRSEIKALNNARSGFKSFEQVTPFLLIVKPFEVGDELTNLLKMKRVTIMEKYKYQIEELYKSGETTKV
ncbi:AMP-binding enzyme [Leptospira broomii serovar Hurstbridge str. 5399]|uniref:AMP-binding enzyme n=1 Tax=Leptospira broomii serovar Hurstbridge str. 5399 TaxID=1049789 RepID=T0EY71_9LEPT|nr:AMP-binding protein [Leptospira broomii]EQA43790.1 AMP-binding enzyme [Leptospira broomii serovar Hurstbridge str. 5399]